MQLPDQELVIQLEARDGQPLGAFSRPHSFGSVCKYADVYGEDCPWCEAEQRRNEREAAEKRADQP